MSLSQNKVLIELKKTLANNQKVAYNKCCTDLDTSTQRYHDAIERSCANMYDKYTR